MAKAAVPAGAVLVGQGRRGPLGPDRHPRRRADRRPQARARGEPRRAWSRGSPQGMRAFAIEVNEQTGVSGFVLPDHRVDVVQVEPGRTASPRPRRSSRTSWSWPPARSSPAPTTVDPVPDGHPGGDPRAGRHPGLGQAARAADALPPGAERPRPACSRKEKPKPEPAKAPERGRSRRAGGGRVKAPEPPRRRRPGVTGPRRLRPAAPAAGPVRDRSTGAIESAGVRIDQPARRRSGRAPAAPDAGRRATTASATAPRTDRHPAGGLPARGRLPARPTPRPEPPTSRPPPPARRDAG